jgi:ribosome-associated heat shock protein Hsp15
MTEPGQRIDRWLWFARFLKTRTLAAKLVAAGKVRVNGGRVSKPSHMVVVGDVLTFALGARVRVVKVAAAGSRRGPYAEACLLYEDLTPPEPPRTPDGSRAAAPGGRPRGSGRPTKKDRRSIDDWRGGST